ncbi:MAG: hypothetical protein ACI3YK_00330 [Eubacteriales bacterium]
MRMDLGRATLRILEEDGEKLTFSLLSKKLIEIAGKTPFRERELADAENRILSAIRKKGDAEQYRKLRGCDYTALAENLSGIHPILMASDPLYRQEDAATRSDKRIRVEKYARRHRISKNQAAQIYEEVPGNAFPIRQLLPLAAAILCTAVPVLWWDFPVLLALILVFPLYEGICYAIYGAIRLYHTPETFPSLSEQAGISRRYLIALAGKINQGENLCDRLEQCYFADHTGNPVYALILSGEDAPCSELMSDYRKLTDIQSRISKMEEVHGASFLLFFCKRAYDPDKRLYRGFCRSIPRELTCFARGMDSRLELLTGETEAAKDCDTLLWLGEDGLLPCSFLPKLSRILSHPKNLPVVEDHRVTGGYGGLRICSQSVYRTNLTPFSALGIVHPGSSLAVDIGLLAEIPADLPFEFSVSERLSIGYCDQINTYSVSSPTPCDYFRRIFSASRETFSGLRRKFRSDHSRGRLLHRILQDLTAPITLSALLIGSVFPAHRHFILLAALSVYLLPALPVLFRDGREVYRRFFSTVLPEFWRAITAALFRIAAIPSAAASSVSGILRSASKRRYGKFLSDRIILLILFPVNLLCGLLLLRVRGWMRLLGIVWMLFPPFLSVWNKIRPTTVMSKPEREELSDYAGRTWHYFESLPDTLPPFGVQLAPYPMTWDYTTPATLGLTALAGLAAYDLGKIDAHTLVRRSSNLVDSLARLPKKKGLFYEKYHTDQPELYGGPTVRTDETGILVASLFCLQIGLTELSLSSREEAEVRDRTVGQIESMLSGMDFSLLSCEDRPCLRSYVTSKEPDTGDLCDRFASGDLLTLFFGVCLGKLPESYLTYPEARLIERGGYLGYRSAHGALDDYLLPYLFLPLAKRSLAYEGSHLALLSQMASAGRQKRRIWGSGEGDCFAFDDDRRPIPIRGGDPSLAEMTADSDTVHPYTSFLAGSLLPHRSLANLRRQVRMGAYGVYGFYEAVDFAKERVGGGYAITEGYRTAHQALILISLTNLLCNRPFERRLLSDPRVRSHLSLLIRPIPKSASIPIKVPVSTVKSGEQKTPPKKEKELTLALIGDPFLSAILSDAGHFQLFYKGSAVNRHCFDPHDPAEVGESIRLFASVGDRYFNGLTGELSVGEHQLDLHADRMGLITGTTLKRLSDTLPVWSLELRADGDPGRFTAALMICLSADKGSGVETLPGMNLILIRKGDLWMGIGVGSPAWFCDLFTDPRLLPYGYSDRDLYDLLEKAEPKSELPPANTVFGMVRLKKMGRGPIGFRILLSESRSELLRNHKISLSLAEAPNEVLHSPTSDPLEQWMLSACLFSGSREIRICPSADLPMSSLTPFQRCAEALSRRGFFCKLRVAEPSDSTEDRISDHKSNELFIGKEDSVREICADRIRISDRPSAPTDPTGSERLYGNRRMITCLTPHSPGYTVLCDPILPITSPPLGACRPFMGEALSAVRDGESFPLFSRVSGCLFTDECAIYKMEESIGGRILVGCDPDLPVKLILTDRLAIDSLDPDIRPFDVDTLPDQIRAIRDEDTLFYKRDSDNRTVYVCKRTLGRDYGILIGSYLRGSEREYYAALEKYRTADDFQDAFVEYGCRCKEYEGITQAEGMPDADFVRQAHLWSIFGSSNRFAPFLFLLYYQPDAFRERLLGFASEMPASGDYSDDYLELVFGCGRYLERSDDREILSRILPYHGGVYRESLYLHLIRILEGCVKTSAAYARAVKVIVPYLPADEFEVPRTPIAERERPENSTPPLCKGDYADYLWNLADRVLGLKVYPDHFTLSPSPIRHPISYELRIKGCHYTLKLFPGDENLFRIDGKIVNNYFSFEKSDVLLEITVAKFKKKV